MLDTRSLVPRLVVVACLLCVVSLAVWRNAPISAQSAGTGDWPLHNLDTGNARFSPLDQIGASNAARLAVLWSYELPAGTTAGSQTPIVVGGVMYFNSGSKMFALDAASGTPVWIKDLPEELTPGGRGPAYGDGKVFAVTRTAIYALDAKSGAPVDRFGDRGVVHILKKALDFKDPGKYAADFDPTSIGYMIASAPTYYGGTLYAGLAQADSLIAGGLIAALDGRTGAVKWVFRAIPQGPADDGWEIAKDTWSGPVRQGGGIWTQPALDPELGLLYANISNPSPNYDGSSRKGANLFTNSIVALRMDTGKLVWHYQAIHHDIWDWDLMTGPTLFEVTVGDRRIKALASLAKTCYVYELNRETGAPIFPIVETPVPMKTDMPGEAVFPTQPIPYTSSYVPQTPFCATYPDVADPELAARRRPMFHPYQVNEFVIVAPGLTGGPNRGSSSFSARTGLLYVTGKNDAYSMKARPVGSTLAPGPKAPGNNFAEQGKTGVTATQNVAAYDPATGQLAWVTKFDGITNGGNLVTAGDVLFQGVGRDFYAVDAKSGKVLARVPTKTAMSSTPLAYEARGKQLVAIASGSTVMAFGLP